MADNTILPGTGENYASNDIGGVKYQRVKISVGEPGVAVDLSHLNPMPVMDFPLMVAMGLCSDCTQMNKFGENPAVATGTVPEDIWDFGGIYIFSTGADIDSISSADNGDTQEITIIGLDANWDEVTQTIAMTGQTRKALTTALIRVYRAWNANAVDIAGAVFIYENTALTDGVPDDTTKIRAMIRDGNNQTLMCIYSVPRGKTAYFISGYVAVSEKTNASAAFSWRARAFGGVFQVKSKIGLIATGSSTWAYRYGVPVAVPEKADIVIRCEDVSQTVAVSGGFDLILRENP